MTAIEGVSSGRVAVLRWQADQAASRVDVLGQLHSAAEDRAVRAARDLEWALGAEAPLPVPKTAESAGFGVETSQKGNSLEQDGQSNTLESNKGVNVDVYA